VKSLFIFLFILSVPTSFSEVLKFDVSGYKRELFSYKEVCEEMGVKHLVMIEVLDPVHLDCMGKKVNVKNFCLKKVNNGNFIRGYINSKLSEVACEMGREAFVSIGCDKRDKHFCKNPIKGCEKLNRIFAHSHALNHYSFNEKDVDNVLNCYFSLPVKLKQAKVKEVAYPPFKQEPVIDDDIFEFDKVQKRFSLPQK
jgi:hypothetical protein